MLPVIIVAESIERTRIHSAVGLTSSRVSLITTCPFRAPHHTNLDTDLIGG
jgi:magnesium chelatase family protein